MSQAGADSHDAAGRSGAQICADALVAGGINTVFGIPGAFGLPLVDALGHHPQLDCVTARHEQGAAFAADGYARVSGRPAACLLSYGPGLLNGLTAIATARADRIPLLVLATAPGAADRARPGHVHQSPWQEELVRQLDVPVVAATEAAGLAAAVRRACQLAAAGPAMLQLDDDLLGQQVTDSGASDIAESSMVAPSAELIELTDRLANARRPVLVAGGGLRGHADREALRSLAERLAMPVLTTVLGKGVLAESHPLSAGHCLHTAAGAELLADADACLVAGTNLGVLDSRDGQLPLPRPIIRLDSHPCLPAESLYQADLTIRASLADIVGPLLAILPAAPAEAVAEAAAGVAAVRQTVRRQLGAVSEPAVRLVDLAAAAVGPTGHVVLDVTVASGWFWNLYPAEFPAATLSPFEFAPLGYALPAAIGAQLADPAGRVLCVVGDGGFLFSAPELATAAASELPLVILVLNDGRFGSTTTKQQREFGREAFTKLSNPDFASLGSAFGARSSTIGLDDLAEVLPAAFAERRLTLLELPIALPLPLASTPNTLRSQRAGRG